MIDTKNTKFRIEKVTDWWWKELQMIMMMRKFNVITYSD